MNTVLIFRSAALGDFILAAPALAQIRRHYPGRCLILLTTTSADKTQRAKVENYAGRVPSLQDGLPWTVMATPHLIDETLVVPDLASVGGIRLARDELQQHKFECGLMLLDPCSPWPGRLKKWMMMKLVTRGAPILGWRARGSLNGNREGLRAAGLLRHHVHGPMQFMQEMRPPRAYTDWDIRFDLRPQQADREWALQWLASHAPAGKRTRWVAVAPGSIQPHKQWPIENFLALCGSLADRFPDIAFIVLGTPADSALGARLQASLGTKRCFVLAGQSSIAQSAALLARVDLLVGNDGGAMHLGDAMGAKVVSIVPGLEYPDSIEPWHNRHRAVRHPVSCAPCYSFTHCPQGHDRCMAELPVAAVQARCEEALTEALDRPPAIPTLSS